MGKTKGSKGKTKNRGRSKSVRNLKQGAAEPVAVRSRSKSFSSSDLSKSTIRLNKRMLRDAKLLPPEMLDSVQDKSAGFERENFSSTFARDKKGALLVVKLNGKAKSKDPDDEAAEILADINRMKQEDPALLKENETFPKTVVVNSDNNPNAKEEAQTLINKALEKHNKDLPIDQQLEASSARPLKNDRSETSFLFVIRPKTKTPEANVPNRPILGRLRPPASADPLRNGLKRTQSLTTLSNRPQPVESNNTPPAVADRQVNNAEARILSVAAFKEATPARNNTLRRTAPYRAIVSKLTDYHKSVAKLKKEITQMEDRLREPSQRKNALLQEKFKKERERKKLRDEMYSNMNAMVTLGINLIDVGPDGDPENIARIKSIMTDVRAQIQTKQAEINRLTAELVPIDNAHNAVVAELKTLMSQNNQQLIAREIDLENREVELETVLDQYLTLNSDSEDTAKLDAIRSLRAKLGDEKKSKQRVDDILQSNGRVESAHLISKPMEGLSSDTASDVLRVQTNGEIGDSGTSQGFAKRAMSEGDIVNDAVFNLAIDTQNENLKENPKLLARQVISSRLDRALGMDVLAVEVFSQDEAGDTIGITAEVSGTQMAQAIDGGHSLYPRIDLLNAETQRGMSDLQLLDALTGQMDRHLGNVFVDQATGTVKGIDNDMAFPTDLSRGPVREGDNTLKRQFTENEDGSLTYHQTHIHKDTAERILNMTEASFIEIIKGRDTDLESLADDNEAIQMALLRLRAVKAQIQKLKDEDKLVEKFTVDTFYESVVPHVKTEKGKESNYLSRAFNFHKSAGDFRNRDVQGK